MPERAQFLQRPDRPALAYRRSRGAGPELVWLSGFRSDMLGTKAAFLHERAMAAQRAFTRFDYAGCGESEGAFEDQTIGAWLKDSLAVIDLVAEGPLILIGSSMGGWLALLAALARPERIAGLVLIAPAPDFTVRVRAGLGPDAQAALARDGVWMRASAYGDGPYPFTVRLLEEAQAHLLMQGPPIAVEAPVRILQGQQDPDVPWEGVVALAARLASRDVQLTLIKDGDHRLSRPQDLHLLAQVVFSL